MLALTIPTTITVVTELDWMIQVTGHQCSDAAGHQPVVGNGADHFPQPFPCNRLHPLGHVFHAQKKDSQAPAYRKNDF
jgi:hypothetical protein